MSLSINFSYEAKPTSVLCRCIKCNKSIEKGKMRFMLQALGYRQTGSLFYHPPCFLKEVKEMMKVGKKDKWLEGVYLGIRMMMES